MKKSILIIICCCFSCSYSSNTEALETGVWKYGAGFYLGGLVSFGKESKYTLKEDSVFNNHIHIGFIDYSSKKEFIFVSKENQEKGFYSFFSSKEESIQPRE